ncbi:MAG TPA: Rieske 2Fe-2S domain-containing protein [Candidatus Limnocylindrales bacterium]
MTHPDPGGPAPGTSPRGSRAGGSPLPTLALLPLRVFLGVTYLYAGLDKVANAHFLASGDAFSVATQLAGYARTSPLAPLINASMPLAVPIGFLIALAELAVGLGLLTGLAFRLAAVAGVGLSLLFWLTASWSVTPYFFSPDLPYGVGFLTLALAGDAALPIWRLSAARRGKGAAARAGEMATASALGRRAVLEVGLLGVLTLLAAAVGAPLRLLGYGERGAAQTGSATPAPSPSPASPAPSATPSPTPTPTPAGSAPASSSSASASAAPTAPPATQTAVPPTPTAVATGAASGGPVIANVADFASGNSLPFTVPNQVPFAMGPGGPGILVKLGTGSVVAYSAVCTHGRCTVGFDQAAMVIACPCHLATYDPGNSAAVLGGPAPLPLPAIPLAIDGSGQIHVTATA